MKNYSLQYKQVLPNDKDIPFLFEIHKLPEISKFISIDNHNLTYEKKFNDIIRAFPQDKTVIIITHRLSSIFAANRIVFMKEGHVICDGTHEFVYNHCPEYKSMFDEQVEIFTNPNS